MKLLTLFGMTASLLVAGNAWAAPVKYAIDKEHTSITFMIKHVGFSSMIGQFRKFDGYIEFDREHPEKSVLHVNIDPNSIQTSSAKLDDELKLPKFFDTKKYSNMHFASKKIKVTGANTAEVTGNLKMHGTTHPVTLNVTLNKEGDMFGQKRIGFSARGSLKRSDFGISEGIPMVDDKIKLIIEAEGVKG